MMQKRGMPFDLLEALEKTMIECSLCGKLWHIDDMDEEYPDCCKSCVENTE